MQIGLRISPFNYVMREARKALGLTQAQLAEKVGASQSIISGIERFTLPVSDLLAEEIALVLGVFSDDLFPPETRSKEWLWEWNSLKRVVIINMGWDELPTDDIEQLEISSPEEATINALIVREALATLSEREQFVLCSLYGFFGGRITLKETAELMKEHFGAPFITVERVRQIAMRALKRLRHPSRARLFK